MQTVPLVGRREPAPSWLFSIASPKRAAGAHHLAGRAHLRAEDRVDAGELVEREDRFLDREVRRDHLAAHQPSAPVRASARPCSARRSSPAAGRSPSRRTAPCARRAGSPRARRRPRRRPRPGSRTARSSGRRPSAPCAISVVWRRSSSCSAGGSEYGGSEQAESPEWMPACSMCSMMPPIITSVAVADAVDVDLDRVVEEAVEQHRRLLADAAPPRACSARGPCRRARSPSRGRRARSSGARPAGSRSRARAAAPAPRCARCRFGGCFRPSSCSSFWKRSRSSAMSIGRARCR